MRDDNSWAANRRWLPWAAALGCLSVVGCGTSTDPTDAPLARQSLVTALESWKAGDPPTKIRDGVPSILMVDAAWDSGQKLESFSILPSEVDDGVNLHCPVKVTLKNNRGVQFIGEIRYVVGTSPKITIFREGSPF